MLYGLILPELHSHAQVHVFMVVVATIIVVNQMLSGRWKRERFLSDFILCGIAAAVCYYDSLWGTIVNTGLLLWLFARIGYRLGEHNSKSK